MSDCTPQADSTWQALAASIGEMSALLPDGSYDAFVIDLTEESEDAGQLQTLVELTIVAGEHKGLVLEVATDSSIGLFEDIVGMPATLTVTNGSPQVRIDD